ncbi:MAG: nitroreductase/quinone reductase family protein [Acidimicrobiia bacterium]|nr:nitroreductase/quinone reductase family protein [Acidimicrobiia bacterium]
MPLNEQLAAELAATRTVDLTTTGRRSGEPCRIEIWWFHVDGRFIITGTPGPRDWFANVLADPSVVIHVNGDDYPARAVPINDHAFRRSVFTQREISWYRTQSELDALVASAPMIEIMF